MTHAINTPWLVGEWEPVGEPIELTAESAAIAALEHESAATRAAAARASSELDTLRCAPAASEPAHATSDGLFEFVDRGRPTTEHGRAIELARAWEASVGTIDLSPGATAPAATAVESGDREHAQARGLAQAFGERHGPVRESIERAGRASATSVRVRADLEHLSGAAGLPAPSDGKAMPSSVAHAEARTMAKAMGEMFE